jgi:hypothetical protein
MKAQVIALAGLDGDIEGDTLVDATVMRTHQHAAGAAGRGWPLPKRRHEKATAGPAAG